MKEAKEYLEVILMTLLKLYILLILDLLYEHF